MALYSPVAFDDYHHSWKIGHGSHWLFVFFVSCPAHNNPFVFFVCTNSVLFFPASSRYIDFNIHGDDGARIGAWNTGSHTVVLSLLDKLGIVGGSPLSTCL